jgi:hypothetical protein
MPHSHSNNEWAQMCWEEFQPLWDRAVLRCEPLGNYGLPNLFEDVQRISEVIGEDRLVPFCLALYSYDLIQQVYFNYFRDHFAGGKFKPIGSNGVLSISARLSPASLPLALLSRKTEGFDKVSHEEYELWQKYSKSIIDQLRRLRYGKLSEKSPEFFPPVTDYQDLGLRTKTVNKHYEIDSLISTRRFRHLHHACENCGQMNCYCAGTSKLRLSFRECSHTDYELQMRQKIFFIPDPDADTVSVSANLSGFTTINAVSRAFGYDWDWVKQVAEVANERKEVICLSDLKPRLIIVPKTIGQNYPTTTQLMTQVIHEANTIGTKVLHMTHYGFSDSLYITESRTILKELMYPHLKTTIERVVFDHDTRNKRYIYQVFKEAIADFKPRFL